MTTGLFWKATAERAVRTFAQTLVAVLTAGATDLLDVDWGGALSASGLAALLAVLTAVASSGTGPDGPGLTETADRAPTAPPAR